ncbi:MAG: patatin-like phospholipase family protein [Paracoccaceae bacterium]
MAIGLVLGGGAPNLPLMTGALLALDRAEVDFKVITTTGAGMVVGLLYAAPRKKNPSDSWIEARRAALAATREWGIDDLIYEVVPINYKIFQKPGMLARAFSHATNPFLWSLPRDNRRQRLLGDTLALAAAAMSPSNLRPSSKGLCQPPPWIELLVDFDSLAKNLEKGDKKFRLSAYCVEDEDEQTFHKEDITAEHFKAALAMPFIYAPYKLNGKTYLEGSAFKTLALNPQEVMSENHIDTIIFFDIMGNRHLIGEPRWLIDAWGKSIIAPLTRLAEQGLEDFKLRREEHKKERWLRELDEIVDLAETDPKLFRLKRDLHMKNRELTDLLELKRLARLSKRDEGLFAKKLEAFVATYMNGQEVADPEALVQMPTEPLVAEIKKLEAQIPSSDDGGVSATGSVIDDADDRQFDRTELLRMPFRNHIPEEQWPKVLDWSYSNMSTLFDIGVKTGEAFYEEHRERLKRSMKRDPDSTT